MDEPQTGPLSALFIAKGVDVERIETAETEQEGRLRIELDKEGAALVKVSGELDYVTRHKLHAVLESLFAQNIFAFALDLSEIDFIDSSGLGLLIMTRRRVDSHDGRMPVVLNPRIERILTTMQLLDFFDRQSSAEAAKEVAQNHSIT